MIEWERYPEGMSLGEFYSVVVVGELYPLYTECRVSKRELNSAVRKNQPNQN